MLPFFISGVLLFLPYLVNVYQYCNSHHAGEIKSDTENALFGGRRNRSMGEKEVSFASAAAVVGARIASGGAVHSRSRSRSRSRFRSRPSSELGCSTKRFRGQTVSSMKDEREQGVDTNQARRRLVSDLTSQEKTGAPEGRKHALSCIAAMRHPAFLCPAPEGRGDSIANAHHSNLQYQP